MIADLLCGAAIVVGELLRCSVACMRSRSAARAGRRAVFAGFLARGYTLQALRKLHLEHYLQLCTSIRDLRRPRHPEALSVSR